MKGLPIISFRGDYAFLSNFYPAEVTATWNGENFPAPTIEHAYMAAKAMNRKDFDRILLAKTAAEAKRIGKSIPLRSAWDAIKLNVMEQLVREKFRKHSELAAKLLATDNRELIEGNTWGDTFWGVCGGVGKNHLGKILMQVREEMKGF